MHLNKGIQEVAIAKNDIRFHELFAVQATNDVPESTPWNQQPLDVADTEKRINGEDGMWEG